MLLTVYLHPKCSTCKNALSFLTDHKFSFQTKDIRETPPTLDELKQMLKYMNGDVKKLFNTSGMTYRELKLSEKLPSLSLSEALNLLKGNGMLIKRPFLIGDDFGLIGFNEDLWLKTLNQKT